MSEDLKLVESSIYEENEQPEETEQEIEDFNLCHARYLLNRDPEKNAFHDIYFNHTRVLEQKVFQDSEEIKKSIRKRRERIVFHLKTCGCNLCQSEIWLIETMYKGGSPIWRMEKNPIKRGVITKILNQVKQLKSFHVDGNWGSFECHEIGGNEGDEYYCQFFPNENSPKVLLKTLCFSETDVLNFVCLMDESTTIRDWIFPPRLIELHNQWKNQK